MRTDATGRRPPTRIVLGLLVSTLSFCQTTTAQFVLDPGVGQGCSSGRVYVGAISDTIPEYLQLAGVYAADEQQLGVTVGYRQEGSRRLVLGLNSTSRTEHYWYVGIEHGPGGEADGFGTGLKNPFTGIINAESEKDAVGVASESSGGGGVTVQLGSRTVYNVRVWLRSEVTRQIRRPWQVDGWSIWLDGRWVAAIHLRARCVSAAWRPCSTRHLAVRGLDDLSVYSLDARGPGRQPLQNSGHLSGSVGRADLFPGHPGLAASQPGPTYTPQLGDFELLTDRVYTNRPVYRHKSDNTFLYFDYFVDQAGRAQAPLWIIGPDPSQVLLDRSSFLYAADDADRPEYVLGQWKYRTDGYEADVPLNITCAGVEIGSERENAADCDFELPGSCGYEVSENTGYLLRRSYNWSAANLGHSKSQLAYREDADGFYAVMSSAGSPGPLLVTSPEFVVSTNSCLHLHYYMFTASFYRFEVSLVNAAGPSRTLLTLTSALRWWTPMTADVPVGTYRLQVETSLTSDEELGLDNVEVVPGSCDRRPEPCGEYPCQSGGTCHPLGRKSYLCACPAGYEGDRCELTSGCEAPEPVKDARLVTVRTGGSLSAAYYRCLPGARLDSGPVDVAAARCLVDRWVSRPRCDRRGTCLEPPAVLFGRVLNTTGLAAEDKARYSCDDGRSSEAVCQPDGHWTGQPDCCRPPDAQPGELKSRRVSWSARRVSYPNATGVGPAGTGSALVVRREGLQYLEVRPAGGRPLRLSLVFRGGQLCLAGTQLLDQRRCASVCLDQRRDSALLRLDVTGHDDPDPGRYQATLVTVGLGVAPPSLGASGPGGSAPSLGPPGYLYLLLPPLLLAARRP